MSRKRTSITLSLFPFLAVLICTMGVLVALLLLVVKQADQSAKAKKETESNEIQSQIESLKNELAENDLRTSVLTDARKKLIEEVTQKRAIRSHLDNEIAQLQERAEKLERDIRAFAKSRVDGDLETLKNQLAANLEHLQRLREREKELDSKVPEVGSGSAAPVYSIVPIAAKNGTDRRPIYIECSAQGITLYPGGHQLNPEDFVLPLQAGNPLDSALVAYREHWRGRNLNGTGAYPLMVVRPSGAHWYAVVRRAMQSWEDEFGYELIPEDWEVKFGPSDEALDKRVSQAIELAMHRQNAMVQMGRAMVLTDPRGSLNPEKLMGSTSTELVPAVGGGFKAVPASHSSAESFSIPNRDNANGMPADPLASLSATYHRQRQADNLQAFGGANGGGSSTVSELNNGSGALVGNSSLESNLTNDNAHNTSQLLNSPISMTHPFGSSSGSSGSSVGTSSQRSSQSPQSSSFANVGSKNGSTSQTALGSQGNASLGPNSGGNSSGMNAMGTPNGSSAAGSVENQNPADAQNNQERRPGQLHEKAIANQRGQNWALPSRRENVSAYHRPILIEVSEQKVVLQPGPWNRESTEIPFQGDIEYAVDGMIDSVWKRVDSWGNLGFDGYWKPVLTIRTTEENLQQVERLEALLDGSGLTIERSKD